jgi:hypothetical protein
MQNTGGGRKTLGKPRIQALSKGTGSNEDLLLPAPVLASGSTVQSTGGIQLWADISTDVRFMQGLERERNLESNL